MVTSGATRSNTNNFYVLPTEYICFVRLSEQRVGIPIQLCNIKLNAPITEMVCAHCAVRTESLNTIQFVFFNPLNPELNPICYLLALLGAHHFFHVSRIRVKLLTFRLLMSYIYIYIYGAPILDVSRSQTTTQHSR